MNAWVDVARTEIVEKYQPGKHDKTAGVLQADKAALQQADRGRKTMAAPDCTKIRTGEKLCATTRNEKNKHPLAEKTYQS